MQLDIFSKFEVSFIVQIVFVLIFILKHFYYENLLNILFILLVISVLFNVHN
jgi:hypothetical protein